MLNKHNGVIFLINVKGSKCCAKTFPHDKIKCAKDFEDYKNDFKISACHQLQNKKKMLVAVLK